MYFIARNNVIYNYIAHTSVMRRYIATIGIVCVFFIGGMYLLYCPLMHYITLYTVERASLQKKYDELMHMNSGTQELSSFIDVSKKNISSHAAASSHEQQEQCHKRMLFVLDTITQLGLQLNAYGSCNTKDKKWYIKDSAHFDIAGSMEKIMTFLETIKNSRNMIVVTHATITHIDDTTFQISCDLDFITVKK